MGRIKMKLQCYIARVFLAIKNECIDILIDSVNAAGKLKKKKKKKMVRNYTWECRTGSWYEDCSWSCAAVLSCVVILCSLLDQHCILVGSLR